MLAEMLMSDGGVIGSPIVCALVAFAPRSSLGLPPFFIFYFVLVTPPPVIFLTIGPSTLKYFPDLVWELLISTGSY